MQMKISEIKINPGRRDTQQRNVEELARSIAAVGLMNPVTIKKAGELDEQIHGTAPLASFNVAQKAPVDIQHSREFFLCVAALDAELADAFSALLYVISHCMASNLKFWGVRDEIGCHGYFAM